MISDEVTVAGGNSKMEERRAVWNFFNNINAWFDTLKNFLLYHKFARNSTPEEIEEKKGELHFFDGQLHRIINLDESEVSTDGTSKLSGGRPSTSYSSTDKSIPKGAQATNKSGYSDTFIGGSTVAGDPLPPHFQLKSTSTTDDGKRINAHFNNEIPHIRGQWGFGNVVERGCTANCNLKSGMDSEKFSKYLQQEIMPLYPDSQDIPGKRVLIIVDSGPGRYDRDMFMALRARGLYLMSGVPNTTHVTQPNDRNYGPFKMIYRNNLTELTRQSQAQGLTIRPVNITILVFRDGDKLRNTFNETFGVNTNLDI